MNLDSGTTQALSPKSDPRVISGTDDWTGGAVQGGAGFPVYAMDGTTCIGRNNNDIWDYWSNPFETSVGVVAPTGNGNNTERLSGINYSPFLDQFANQTVTPDANHGMTVVTGCNQNGTHVDALGDTTDNSTINTGSSNPNRADRVWHRFGASTTATLSFYAISEPLTVSTPAGTVIQIH